MEGQPCWSTEPGHRPPTTPPPAPPRSQDRHQPKSPAAFGAVVGRAKVRHPGAAAIGNLHPDNAAAGPDRDRLSRIARPAIPHTVTKKLPPGLPHPRKGVPGRAHRLRTRGRLSPARPARQSSRSPGRPSQPSAHPPFPARAALGEATGPPGGHTGMHARLNGARQAETRRQRGPSVAVRGKADGAHRPHR
jgi:hypothetical protein